MNDHIHDCTDHTRAIWGVPEKNIIGHTDDTTVVVNAVDVDCRNEDEYGSLVTLYENTFVEVCPQCGAEVAVTLIL